jgi:hypothetical protein
VRWVFVLLLSLCSAAKAQHQTYRSEQYLFSVAKASFATFCVDEPPAAARGFIASPEPTACSDLLSHSKLPVIRFWAEYNLVDEALSARDLANLECAKGTVAESVVKIGENETYTCISKEGGRAEVRLFSQNSNSHVPVDLWINYRARVSVPSNYDYMMILQSLKAIKVKKWDGETRTPTKRTAKRGQPRSETRTDMDASPVARASL